MGSTLTKNYDVESEPSGSGGLSGLWRIYSCKRKTKDRAPLSIFMFDKKRLDRKRTSREEITNSMKAEVLALARLRHPCILQVVEPLLEDSKTLAFVTEPVVGSLSDLLKQPVKLQAVVTDLEVRLGLMDLVEALNFLHSEARLLHLAVCPDNVYLTPNGKWKLAGLTFSQTLSAERRAAVPPSLDFLLSARRQRFGEAEVPDSLAPPLLYTAPEVVGQRVATPASDLFSLAAVSLSVYKVLKASARDFSPYEITDISEQGQKDAVFNALRMASTTFASVPEGLKETLQRFLTVNPDRGQLQDFLNSRGFQDTPTKALSFLEHIQEKQEAQKLQFLKGLHKLIEKFEESLVLRRILPQLSQLIQSTNLAAQVLPSLVEVMKKASMSKEQFAEQVWPCLERLSSGKEISAQTLFILLSEVEVFIKFTTPEQCRAQIMPLVFKAMECGVAQLQEVVLRKTPSLAAKVEDKSYLKVQILPRFLQVLLVTRTPAVREEGLKAITQLFAQFDRSTLVETILPSLDKMRKQDVTSSTSMLLLEAYSSISTLLGPRVAALNIMPALCPLLVEADVGKEQFEVIVATLIEMLQNVKAARLSELTSFKADSQPDMIVPTEHSGDDDIKADAFFNEFFSQKPEDNHPPALAPEPVLFAVPKPVEVMKVNILKEPVQPNMAFATKPVEAMKINTFVEPVRFEAKKPDPDDIFAELMKPDRSSAQSNSFVSTSKLPPPVIQRPPVQAQSRPPQTLSSFQGNPFSTPVPTASTQPKPVGKNPFTYNSDDFFNELLTRGKDPFEGLCLS